MGIMLKNKGIKVLGLALLAVFLASSFGIFHMGMDMGADGNMNCPFSQGLAMCTMTPMDHIAAAQNFFNALPTGNTFALLLTLILGLAVVINFRKNYEDLISTSPQPSPGRRGGTPPRNYLAEAYSSGILNPKPF